MNCETGQGIPGSDTGPLVAEQARQAFEPLHVPATDAVVNLDLKRPMLPAQAHVVTAAVENLAAAEGRIPVLRMWHWEKSNGGLHRPCPCGPKPYRAIVMCPPHLVETWQTELRQVFCHGTVKGPRPGAVEADAFLSPRKTHEADLADHG